jgi:Tol biopolymer transport system component
VTRAPAPSSQAPGSSVVVSPPPLPAPYGLARNGGILVSTPDGDLVRVDPVSGATTPVLATPDIDRAPLFARDGTKFAFQRASSTTPDTFGLYVADADGSQVRELIASVGAIDVLAWSPDGDRLLMHREADPSGRITIVDATTGGRSSFDVGFRAASAMWRPGSDQLVVATPGSVWLVGADGSGRTKVASPSGLLPEQVAVSPDGATLVYPTWVAGAEGRLHVIDIASGDERSVDFDPGFAYTDLSPRFLPDGTHVVVDRHDEQGYRPTVVSIVDGSAVPMGDHHPSNTGGTRLTVAPDGTQVIAIYDDDGAIVVLDPTTGAGRPVAWQLDLDSGATWQRLAP